MKNLGITLIFLFFTSFFFGQEIKQLELPKSNSENFVIKKIPVNPALSNLSPLIPESERLYLIRVNLDTDNLQKRQIDIAQMAMQQEKERQARLVSLDSPFRQPVNDPKTVSFSVRPTQEYSFYNHGFVPKFPSNTTQNSVYKNAGETTGAFYLNSYSPFYRPYSY